MYSVYMTDDSIIHEEPELKPGCWVNMVQPSLEESILIGEKIGVEPSDIMAAVDIDESARIQLEDGYTLILVDIPTTEMRHDKEVYTTIPLGIVLTQQMIVTVCSRKTPILEYFVNAKLKDFSTKKKMRFVYQILFRAASLYQADLRNIDKKRIEIEARIEGETEDGDLIGLHELESTLVYFATSLRANGVVLERLTRYKRLEQYPDDQELLEDIIVENKQAIEMTSIYRDIISGTSELLSSVINNRMNDVMKYLAAITIVMAIPTIISGFYGMNVETKGMPFSGTPLGFSIIAVITLFICIIVLIILKKKKML